MKKQFTTRMLKSVLLLLSVFLLVTGTMMGVFAGATETRALTLTFNSDIEKCLVQIENNVTEEWELYETVLQSGTITVPYNAKVQLTVVPVTGKWPLLTLAGGSISVENGNTIQWSSYKEDAAVSIECTERVYTIHALNYNLKDETPSYNVVAGSAWSITQLIDGTITYQYGTDPLTELPVVEMEDYVFKGWNIKMGEGADDVTPITQSEDGKYYIPKDLTRTKYFDNAGGKIYVYPEMLPIQYPVYREDRVYDSNNAGNLGELLFAPIEQQAPVKYNLSAIEQNFWKDDPTDGYKTYKGYLLMQEYAYVSHKVAEPPIDNSHYNTVYRFYTPITYSLVYLDDNGADLTQAGYTPAYSQYKYSNKIVINQPTRRGYTFSGWKIEVYNATTAQWEIANALTATDFAFGDQKADYNAEGRNDPNAIYASDAQPDGTYEIRLTAQWTANVYSIVYDWGVTDETLKAHLDELNAALPKSFTFDSIDPIDSVSITDPTREGYTFLKWILRYTDEENTPKTLECQSTEGVYTLLCNAYAQDITLSAVWEAKKYTVTLDGMGAAEGYTTKIENVVFDAPFIIPSEGFVIPTRLGFTFDGYWSAAEGGEKYINADGTSNCNAWDLYLDTDGVITLYARWIRNSYDIVIDVTGIPDGVTGLVVEIITANGTYVYGTDTIRLPFETEFTVKITSPDSYKVVTWNGKDVAHVAVFLSDTITVGAENLALSAQLRQKATVPTVNVDYVKEHFLLENGEYLIYLDPTAPIRVQINGNSITVNGIRERAVVIPDSFFGKAISVVYLGGTQYADSDPITVELASRPEPPKYHEQIHSIDNTYDTQIKVIMLEECTGLFEYAISLNPDFALLSDSDWKASQTHTYTFENLQPGTTYYVFIRKAATDTTPHGQVYTQSTATMIAKYYPDVIDRLNGMLNEDDGDLTKELIQNAIDTITEWKDGEDGLPNTFYLDVEALLAAVEAKIAFTRLQDSKIAMLESFRDECLASGSLNDTNKNLLNSLCAQGVADITAATQSADVDRIYQSTMAAMEIVPFTYLYNVDRTLQLFSLLGLNQDSSLSVRRFEDLDALRRMVDGAIRTSGRVVVDTFMSQEDAELLLRTLDVVDAYRFNLINAIVQTNDTFTVRMQIPEALLGMTGLQVAYYDEATGMLELLETTVEGEELVFKAKKVADFVILADPTINLTAVIVALGLLMLCQIIAIGVILVSRSKGKKMVQNACVALPALFMTVHFAPVNAEKLALIMGVAVILLQSILMWLLLSSNMIRARKKRDDGEEEAVVATAEPTAVAEMSPDAYSMAEQVEDELEVEEVSDEPEEVYEDEEFIEPAANPYYSLPNDEGVFAYDDEELAEDESVEYDPDATEENAFDDVFAEEGEAVYSEEDVYEDVSADAEDAYAYDENGYAYDDSAYAYAEVDEEVVSDEEEAIAFDEETEESVLYDDEEVIEEVTDEDGEEDDGFYRYDE